MEKKIVSQNSQIAGKIRISAKGNSNAQSIEKLREEIAHIEFEVAALEHSRARKKSGKHRKKLSKAKSGLQKLRNRHAKLQKEGVIGEGKINADFKESAKGLDDAKSVQPLGAIQSNSPIHQPPIKQEKPISTFPKRRFSEKIYLFLARFASKTQRRAVREKMAYAGMDQDPEIWLGQIILLSKLCALAAFMLFWVAFKEATILTLIAYACLAFLLVVFGAYVHLNVQIDDRRRRLEEVLPDAMQIIAANIRAGMTPVVALRAAARPELGPIQEDIKYATTKSLGTDSFTTALAEMAQKTNSELFRRIVSLFNASLKSGGHLAQLLENTAADIRQSQELRKDLAANTRLYAMFILFTVVIGTPLLLAVSIQFSTMVTSLQAQTSSGGIASEISSIPLVSTPLSVEFLFNSAIIVLLVTSILASALLGVINNASYSSGLKYSPFIAGSALLSFFIIKDVVLKTILPVG